MFSNGFRQEVVLPIQHTHPCIFRVSSFPPLPLSLRSQQQQRVILFLETHSMAPWGMPRLPNGIVCWRASRPIRNSHPILAGRFWPLRLLWPDLCWQGGLPPPRFLPPILCLFLRNGNYLTIPPTLHNTLVPPSLSIAKRNTGCITYSSTIFFFCDGFACKTIAAVQRIVTNSTRHTTN